MHNNLGKLGLARGIAQPTLRDVNLIRPAKSRPALHPGMAPRTRPPTLAAHHPSPPTLLLATVVSRANRSHLIHSLPPPTCKPGQTGKQNRPDPLRMARDLVRCGPDAPPALDVYRVGQTSPGNDGPETRSDHHRPPRTARTAITLAVSLGLHHRRTLAGLGRNKCCSNDELTQDVHAEHRRIVELILDGAPISRQSAEAKLGYPSTDPITPPSSGWRRS